MGANHHIVDIFAAAQGKDKYTDDKSTSSRYGLGSVSLNGSIYKLSSRIQKNNPFELQTATILAVVEALRLFSERNDSKDLHIRVHTDSPDVLFHLAKASYIIEISGDTWKPPAGFVKAQKKFCGLACEFSKVEIVYHAPTEKNPHMIDAYNLAAAGMSSPRPLKIPARGEQRRLAIQEGLNLARDLAA